MIVQPPDVRAMEAQCTRVLVIGVVRCRVRATTATAVARRTFLGRRRAKGWFLYQLTPQNLETSTSKTCLGPSDPLSKENPVVR